MKKVLLISANMMKLPYAVYPLGLDYVAGALQSDYHVEILDMNEPGVAQSAGERIREYEPDYIGLSIRNIDNTDTIE